MSSSFLFLSSVLRDWLAVLSGVTEGYSFFCFFVFFLPQKEPQGSFQSLVLAEEHLCHVVCEQLRIVSSVQLISVRVGGGEHPPVFEAGA